MPVTVVLFHLPLSPMEVPGAEYLVQQYGRGASSSDPHFYIIVRRVGGLSTSNYAQRVCTHSEPPLFRGLGNSLQQRQQ